MKNVNTIIVIFFGVLIIALVSCKGNQENDSDESRDIATIVETTLITKDSAVRIHQIPAVILATKRADLAFQLSGTVDHVMVKIGEKVEQDLALMSLYNPNIDPALESNLAQLESIKAKIVQVKRDVANLRELRKNNSTSKTAFEHKETDLKDLVAQQKSINAQIDLAIANQSESIIKAPFDGVIVAIKKQQGEFIGSGQVVLTINQTDDLEVEVNITHNLWKSLKLGDVIKATYQNHDLELSVVELAQTADSQSHLMKVILKLNVSIDNAIGQQILLHIPETYPDVYQLPLEVIVDDGINRPYIFTSIDGTAQKNLIQPLYIEVDNIVFNTTTPIKGEVVIKGQSKISSGMRLQNRQLKD